MGDPRQVAIERAVRSVALRLLARDQSIAEAVAALARAIEMPDETPREAVAATRQSRRAEMLTELARLEQDGRGRSAATLVARKFARDRLDPVEVESLARQIRRWRRDQISGQCPDAGREAV